MHEPTFGSLFAGIGGIDLGLERAGWRGRWQVEYEPFCTRVLAKHWPDVARYGDIHDVHGAGACPVPDAERRAAHERPEPAEVGRWSGATEQAWVGGCGGCLPPVDLLAGGFPCQPFSNAGRRHGKDDVRWLWPEFARVIGELRPRYVLVENVPGLLAGHGGMGAVLGDLATLGYDAEWDSIPASAVGAPHLRYRVWIVAYADGLGPRRQAEVGQAGVTGSRPQGAGAEPDGAGDGADADADGTGPQGRQLQPERANQRAARTLGVADSDIFRREWGAGVLGPRGWGEPADSRQWLVEPDVGRVAHGVPARVDRLRALGNAVVPQVVEWIGRRILEAEAVTR